MKKNIVFLTVILLSSIVINAQNKKDLIESQTQTIDSLKIVVANLSKENTTLNANITTLQKEIGKQKTELNNLTQSSQSLEKTIASLQDSILAKNDLIVELEDFISSLENPSPSNCSDKQELLTNLVGEYPLSRISAFPGSNIMQDYSFETGEWYGAEIEMQARDRLFIDITKEMEVKLTSMKVTVNQDLSISFISNNKVIFSAPFNKDGMSYFLQNSAQDYRSNLPENLQPSSTFIEDYLYIYAKDKVSLIDMSFAEPFISRVDSYVLKYCCLTGQFELLFFLKNSDNSAIFLFGNDLLNE